nr:SUF system NifU family Fe-S cluster assembly protein [Bacilli bacterium]
HPSNYEKVSDPSYEKYNTNNESCVDNLNFYIKIEDNIIKDLKFEGEACAISKSSSSIFTENVIGKSIEDAINYISNFERMIDQKKYDEDVLKEACCFCDIYKQNNRRNCAFLPYRGLKKYLENYNK